MVVIKPEPTLLHGSGLDPDIVNAIATGGAVQLCEEALKTMSTARLVVEAAIESRTPVYGVTTGLGPRVVDTMPDDSIDDFSLATIRGRAHAVGNPLPQHWVRAGMVVRLNTLLTGAAGARPELAQHLASCLNAGLTPVIPETGTIGVADLTWGGALGLGLIGEGDMHLPDGSVMQAKEALLAHDITPYKPKPREGLAIVSHSTITAGLTAVAWCEVQQAYEAAQTAAALSMEGFRANLSPLDARVLKVRPQSGQDDAAAGIRHRLEGSALFQAGEARRLQDPLSIRNVAQVHGCVKAMLDCTLDALTGELNGASDNPAVLIESKEILSHGGYLPVHLSVTLTALSQSLVHLAALQTARIGKMIVERFSGLTTGLTPVGAAGAGFGPLMKPAETLYAEIAHLATPPPIYPGFSADGLEDVVTHTAIPAKALFPIALRLRQLSALESIVAAQAIDLRELANALPVRLQGVHRDIRKVSIPMNSDRPLGNEIQALANLIKDGIFNL